MKYKGYRCASYEGIRGIGGIAPRICGVSTRQKLVKSFTSGLLFTLGKKICVSTQHEAGCTPDLVLMLRRPDKTAGYRTVSSEVQPIA